VIEENLRLTRARLRTEVRQLDAQIERIRTEDRLFRRYGFGSDLHEIQLVALRAQREELLASLAEAEPRAVARKSKQGGIGSWLLVLPALAAMFVQSIFPRPATGTRSSTSLT
jgi:hypothetical protein